MIPRLPECEAPARQFCATCRNLEGGRPFRVAILKIRGVEAEPDFDCPDGRDWGDPARLTPAEVAQAESNASVCETPCPDSRGVTRERNGFQVYRVKCRRCGCGGLDLVKGKCPKGLWGA